MSAAQRQQEAKTDARLEAQIGAGWNDDDQLDDDADLEGEVAPRVIRRIPTTKENPMSEKTCTRDGCGKKLRSNNTKGICSSGCLSSDAPPTHRAAGVIDIAVMRKPGVELEPAKVELRAEKKQKRSAKAAREEQDHEETLRRFRLLAEALGVDADQVLATFAESWISKARDAITEDAA